MANKPAKNKSLLASLVIRISAIVVIGILVLMTIVYTQVDSSLEILRDQTVEQQARSIAENLEPNKGRNKVFLNLPETQRRFYAQAGDTYQYLVRDEAGNRLFTSPITFADYFPDGLNAGAGNTGFTFDGPGARKYVGLTFPVNVEGRQLYVQVAQTLATADRFSDLITDAFMARLLLVGIPFYFCLVGVIVLTLRRGLKPLHRAAQEVRQIDIYDHGIRIPEAGVPSEVMPLVKAVNLSFARLEKSLETQQEFTDNVAHELRTPLAILKTRIENLDRTEPVIKLLRDVDAMTKLVNQMLDATRLEYADAMEMKRIDLAAVLSRACQDFFPIFVRAKRELRVNGVDTPVYVEGNSDLIYRAICNLFDNALAYSPPGTPVDAELDGFTIMVTDQGKKIPEDRRGLIFERHHRDSAPTAARTGAGLGLSIVRKTMEVHDGTADLDPRAHTGNRFRMIFPARRSAA
ncbi:MAG: ATP-binding protein [Micavibrio sp.]|nr:ATP-binding protein [Micavibrio sp.]